VIFTRTAVDGCVIVDLERREDARGFFARTFCADEFSREGLETRWVQANAARTAHSGTIRGLHWQVEPHAEAKLVSCTAGAVFDVAVDVRPTSPTYLRWTGVELAAETGRMLYLPPGTAHGYQALTDDASTWYLVSAAYAPEAERGLRWDDPALRIEWPLPNPAVSEKDQAWPLLTGGGTA
jgi:dTDP-4-dehydrorhamnose 3,5-epimerase